MVLVGLVEVADFLVVVVLLRWDDDLVDETVFLVVLVGCDRLVETTDFLVIEVVTSEEEVGTRLFLVVLV